MRNIDSFDNFFKKPANFNPTLNHHVVIILSLMASSHFSDPVKGEDIPGRGGLHLG